jgi:hypothetical protein
MISAARTSHEFAAHNCSTSARWIGASASAASTCAAMSRAPVGAM